MIKTVACGISGGVDSAVSAYLLKKQFNVIGVFMKNWDGNDEFSKCTIDEDRESAKYVCEKLKIPFVEINFVKDYWNFVFEDTLKFYEKGFTPNPDILCNKHIKFNRFAQYCLDKLGVDAFATGHYARSSYGQYLERRDSSEAPLLMRPTDRVKDQTFWLCQVNVKYLAHCMFPLADKTKIEVKQIASDIGLDKTVARKESMGICFIGKRKFRKFIDSYIEPKKGVFTLLESGKVVGTHNGIHYFTLGQKSGLSFDQSAYYVAKLNPETQEIKLVSDVNHPALFMKNLVTDVPHWLIKSETLPLNFRSKIQYQNKYRSFLCSVKTLEKSKGLQIQLDQCFRCIAPGQFAVLYSEDNEICIGSSQILASTSIWEEGHLESVDWDSRIYENKYDVNKK